MTKKRKVLDAWAVELRRIIGETVKTIECDQRRLAA
jgi:hypothetical protein